MINQKEIDYKKALGENIRKIRKRSRLTQDAFSEIIGLEPSSLSNIENGKSFPSVPTLIQIQQQFRINPEEIFDVEYLKNINLIERDLHVKIDRLDNTKKRMLWQIVRYIEF